MHTFHFCPLHGISLIIRCRITAPFCRSGVGLLHHGIQLPCVFDIRFSSGCRPTAPTNLRGVGIVHCAGCRSAAPRNLRGVGIVHCAGCRSAAPRNLRGVGIVHCAGCRSTAYLGKIMNGRCRSIAPHKV